MEGDDPRGRSPLFPSQVAPIPVVPSPVGPVVQLNVSNPLYHLLPADATTKPQQPSPTLIVACTSGNSQPSLVFTQSGPHEVHRCCVPAWSDLPPTQLTLLSVSCCSAREPPLIPLSALPPLFLVLTCVGWVLWLHPAQATSPWHSKSCVAFVTTGPGSTHTLFWRLDLPVDDMNRFSLV